MTWDPINLALLGDRDPITPSIGGLVYPGGRHVWSGLPETAKTFGAYSVGIDHVRNGGTTVIVDFEMGPYDARDRLRDMGATNADLARLPYIEPGNIAAGPETLAHLVDEFAPTLVIIDAAAGAYDLQGLDDNKRADAELFARTLTTPLWQRGVASILLDHVVKKAGERGKFAIGSERKVGGADVHLGFETITALSRGGHGRYAVVVHKDRFGHLPRPKAAEFVVESNPTTYAITASFVLETADQAASETSGGWLPTETMQRISCWLEARGQPASRHQVETNVFGKTDTIRQALDALVARGFVSETAGSGKTRLYAHLAPYDPESPEVAPGRPGFAPGEPTSSTGGTSPLAPPPRGGEGEPLAEQPPSVAPVPAEVEELIRACHHAGVTPEQIAHDLQLQAETVAAVLAEPTP